MKYNDYKNFANCTQRNHENLINILTKIMPYYSEITKTKKKNILQNFEEVEYHSKGTILEREGLPAEYMYIILRGEIQLYKKLPDLYDKSRPRHELEAQLVNITEKKPL